MSDQVYKQRIKHLETNEKYIKNGFNDDSDEDDDEEEEGDDQMEDQKLLGKLKKA